MPMHATQDNLLGVGIYTVPEAARLTRVSPSRIRRWIRGYTYATGAGSKASPPVWQRQLPELGGELALGFLDLVEVRLVNAMLDSNFGWKTIRRARENARALLEQ